MRIGYNIRMIKRIIAILSLTLITACALQLSQENIELKWFACTGYGMHGVYARSFQESYSLEAATRQAQREFGGAYEAGIIPEVAIICKEIAR